MYFMHRFCLHFPFACCQCLLLFLFQGLHFETSWIVFSGEENCPAPWPQCGTSLAAACLAAWHGNSESKKRRNEGTMDTEKHHRYIEIHLTAETLFKTFFVVLGEELRHSFVVLSSRFRWWMGFLLIDAHKIQHHKIADAFGQSIHSIYSYSLSQTSFLLQTLEFEFEWNILYV